LRHVARRVAAMEGGLIWFGGGFTAGMLFWTGGLAYDIVLRKGKVYPLLREKKEEVYKFINEQLRKRYIRPLKSPQITLVFFIGKKNGKKHMVQDYWYLNKWTIKNNYSLLLILDIVENIGMKRVFTKLDL